MLSCNLTVNLIAYNNQQVIVFSYTYVEYWILIASYYCVRLVARKIILNKIKTVTCFFSEILEFNALSSGL